MSTHPNSSHAVPQTDEPVCFTLVARVDGVPTIAAPAPRPGPMPARFPGAPQVDRNRPPTRPFRKPTNRFASRSLLKSTTLTVTEPAPRTGKCQLAFRGLQGSTEVAPTSLPFRTLAKPDCFTCAARAGGASHRCYRSTLWRMPARFPVAPQVDRNRPPVRPFRKPANQLASRLLLRPTMPTFAAPAPRTGERRFTS
jgi:hypothetical protein